jgi:hypothetical protein
MQEEHCSVVMENNTFEVRPTVLTLTLTFISLLLDMTPWSYVHI